MHSLRLNRLLSIFKAALCIGAALASLDIFLGLALGVKPAWLPASIASGLLTSFGSRLARVEQLKQAGDVEDSRLVVITGLSPVRNGLDPVLLKASDPLHRDWLVLGAQGRTFATLEVYARMIADSQLRPINVVLGITPAMLHHDDHAVPQDAAPAKLIRHLRHGQINHAALDCSWLYRNRDELADGGTLLLYEAARETRSALHLAMSATYPPEKDPWSSWADTMQSRADNWQMNVQWQGHQQLLVPEQFQSVERQVNALRTMVRQLRANGSQVVFVLVPQTMRLRTIEPPIVAQRFAEALSVVGDEQPVKLIDLRGAIPDDFFWDDAHLNPQGRYLLSTQLPSLLP
jgi:hypothetical protein